MSQSSLERAFAYYWQIFASDYSEDLTEQCYFSFERDFRFDFAIIHKLLAVEVHGGGFVRGRHHREQGMSEDFEKHNAATALGWRIIYTTSSMLNNDPESVFKPILTLLGQPVLSPDYEMVMWTARIRNLTSIGANIQHNGIGVQRDRRNSFLLELGGKAYHTLPKKTLIEGQKETLNLILNGSSSSATPASLQNQSKSQAQMALFSYGELK